MSTLSHLVKNITLSNLIETVDPTSVYLSDSSPLANDHISDSSSSWASLSFVGTIGKYSGANCPEGAVWATTEEEFCEETVLSFG